jgi:SAM-dependent methyltransferase
VRQTTERHDPKRVRSVEELVIHLMHVYAYSVVREYARPTDRILEVGFGEGYGSELIRDWVAEYHGVEVDEEAVEHASSRHAHPKCTFHHAGSGLPFPDDRFDLVLSFQVIEHVEDVEGFLAEIRRVTRPGGTILVVTPNRNHRLADGERPWNRYHVREFSPPELERVLAEAGVDVELYGIHGTPEFDAVERTRVARARKLARVDRLGLRYVLPERFDTWLRRMLKRGAQAANGFDASSFTLADVRRSREQVESSLDLLAVTRV